MRKLFYLVLGLIGLMGTLTIGVSNAAGTITIIDAPGAVGYSGLKFDDGNGHVIMLLDRNLGATSRGITNTAASFGYHFQWGNNYGFVNSGDILLGNTRVPRKPAYENKGYSGNVFITGDSTNNDYWEGNLHYDGLRGGSGDSLSNGWGLSGMTEGNVLDKKANIKKRQGPCPDGYHVPSAGEWNNLLKYRTIANGHDFSVDTLGFVSISGTNKNFTENLYIPFASRRRTVGDRYEEPLSDDDAYIYANLWSSSLSGDHARSIQVKRKVKGNVGSFYTEADAGEFYWRIIGQSVRCFYDSYLLPEFEISFYDGDDIVGSKSVREGDFLSEDDMPSVTKSGHSIDYRYLSGDDTTGFDFNNTMITGNIILKPHWKINRYTITFVKGNGEDNYVFTGNYGSGLIPPANPKRAGYTFKGWDQNVPDTIPDYDMTINAVREKSGGNGGSSGGGGSSNGGGSNKTGENNTTSGTNTTTSGTDKNDTRGNTQISSGSTQNNNQFTDEFQQAYEFAYNNGITTMPTIGKANMGGKLTRIAMAKMLSQYAINILGKNPDVTKVNKFNDVTDELDEEYNNGVTLAYQLGIMGINMPENNFRPKDEVTRAEFVTALSRMIYGTSDGEYKGTGKYYLNHMAKLMKEGIITKDDPNMKELRGYVMIMLMRSIKG